MRKLLLHVCCGPCASATIPWWRSQKADLCAFFYNPNIHPLLEYRRRLTAARDVAEMTGSVLVVDETYDPEAWFDSVAAAQPSRCSVCIGQRLERAAVEAVAQGCDAFTTTLAISPWQDHEAIQSGGARAAARQGVDFVYEDLRHLYEESRRLSKEWGIYRQKYCGCLVSEWERYRNSRPRAR